MEEGGVSLDVRIGQYRVPGKLGSTGRFAVSKGT